MSLDENKALARRYLEDVLNKRDFTAAASLLGDHATDNVTGSLSAALTLAAFPDFHVSPEHVLAERDLVTVLATYTGTHRRTYMGVPPTGNGVTGRIAFAFRITEGRISETWTEIEPWGLLQQLGVPFRGGAPAPVR